MGFRSHFLIYCEILYLAVQGKSFFRIDMLNTFKPLVLFFSFFFLLSRLCLFRAVLNSQQNLSRRYRDFLHTPGPQTHRASPSINLPHHCGTLITTDELCRHIIVNQCPQFTLGFTLRVVRSMGFGPFLSKTLTCTTYERKACLAETRGQELVPFSPQSFEKTSNMAPGLKAILQEKADWICS